MATSTTSSSSSSSPSRGAAPARRRRLGPTVPALAAVAALALLAAACSGDDDDTVAGDASGSGGGGDDMTVAITEPSDSATVEGNFEVALDSSVDIGEPDTGLHHVHLYYDGETADGDYDIVYSVDEPWTVDRDLGPGEHTIEAVIANADHSLTDARDGVTVTVGDAGGGTTTTGGRSSDGY